MDIIDFIPIYPNITDINFSKKIHDKQEFNDLTLETRESYRLEQGTLLKHQATLARFMSSGTPYNGLLVVHDMGTGKTCAAVGAMEQIRKEKSHINGAIIIAQSDKMLDNFKDQAANKCTWGQYQSDKQTKSVNKLFTDWCKTKTFQKFAKQLKNMKPDRIKLLFSNKVIIIDEVHNLRQHGESKNDDTYGIFHKFLHEVENCKILLLSGTPMKDTANEIASIMNLILPRGRQLMTGERFKKKYITERTPATSIELKEYFRGKVSYLSSTQSDVKISFKGDIRSDMKYFKTKRYTMSPFHEEVYNKAVQKDRDGESSNDSKLSNEDKKNGLSTNARQASLCVYPNGMWAKQPTPDINGKPGKPFDSYKDSIISNMKLLPNNAGNIDANLKIVSKYSSKYAGIIGDILKHSKGKNWFIYSHYVTGSGIYMFKKLLKYFGYTQTKGSSSRKGNRFAVLSGSVSRREFLTVQKSFNRLENKNGDYLKVIIGSGITTEGFSFMNVQRIAILTPHWNYTQIRQAIARGIRFNSHKDLEHPEVKIYLTASSTTDSKGKEMDIYRMAEDKEINMSFIIRLIMESAVDCHINKVRNSIKDVTKNKSAACQYGNCEWECDGDSKAYRKDTQSTHEQWLNNTRNPILDSISDILMVEGSYNMKELVSLLEESGWSRNYIYNSLAPFESSKILYYHDFVSRTVNTEVTSIELVLRRIFSRMWKISLGLLINFIKYENKNLLRSGNIPLIHTLNKCIRTNTPFKNRYGLTSYLREQADMYFLVTDIHKHQTIDSSWVTENPILFNNDISILTNGMVNDSLGQIIDHVNIPMKNKIDMYSILNHLPLNVQLSIIELCIIGKKSIKKVNALERILYYYSGDIHSFDNKTVISFPIYMGKVPRLLDYDNKWVDSTPDMYKEIDRHIENVTQQKRSGNKTSYFGKLNPKNGQFCIGKIKSKLTQTFRKGLTAQLENNNKNKKIKIKNDSELIKSFLKLNNRVDLFVIALRKSIDLATIRDLRRELIMISAISIDDEKSDEKTVISLLENLQPNSKSTIVDNMLKDYKSNTKVTGTVLSEGGFVNNQRLDLVINNLKLPHPVSFGKDKTSEQLKANIKKISKEKYLRGGETIDNLRRIYYWITRESGGGNKRDSINEHVKRWFTDKNFMEIDNNCGVSDKIRISYFSKYVQMNKEK